MCTQWYLTQIFLKKNHTFVKFCIIAHFCSLYVKIYFIFILFYYLKKKKSRKIRKLFGQDHVYDGNTVFSFVRLEKQVTIIELPNKTKSIKFTLLKEFEASTITEDSANAVCV